MNAQTPSHSQLNRLVHQIQRRVTSYLSGRIRQPSIRQDIGQETLTIWIARYRDDPTIGVGYAINICKNLLKRHYERDRVTLERHATFQGDEPRGVMPRQISSLGISEEGRVTVMCERLQVAVESLSKQHCQVFELKYVENLKNRETAAALGVSTSTVDRRVTEIIDVFRTHGADFDADNLRECLHALRRLLTRFER